MAVEPHQRILRCTDQYSKSDPLILKMIERNMKGIVAETKKKDEQVIVVD